VPLSGERYGFGSNFSAPITFQTATAFRATNAFFGGDPFPGQVKEVDALGSGDGITTGTVPQQWTKVANEGDVIKVPAGTTVRYGFGSNFTAPITFQVLLRLRRRTLSSVGIRSQVK
jgi:hypothetical protein